MPSDSSWFFIATRKGLQISLTHTPRYEQNHTACYAFTIELTRTSLIVFLDTRVPRACMSVLMSPAFSERTIRNASRILFLLWVSFIVIVAYPIQQHRPTLTSTGVRKASPPMHVRSATEPLFFIKVLPPYVGFTCEKFTHA